jgi:hypothetical protein
VTEGDSEASARADVEDDDQVIYDYIAHQRWLDDSSDTYAVEMGRFLFAAIQLEVTIGRLVVGLFEVDTPAETELSEVFLVGTTSGQKLEMLRRACAVVGLDATALKSAIADAETVFALRNQCAHQVPQFSETAGQLSVAHRSRGGKTTRRLVEDLSAEARRAGFVKGDLLRILVPIVARRRADRLGQTAQRVPEESAGAADPLPPSA